MASNSRMRPSRVQMKPRKCDMWLIALSAIHSGSEEPAKTAWCAFSACTTESCLASVASSAATAAELGHRLL